MREQLGQVRERVVVALRLAIRVLDERPDGGRAEAGIAGGVQRADEVGGEGVHERQSARAGDARSITNAAACAVLAAYRSGDSRGSCRRHIAAWRAGRPYRISDPAVA